MTIVTNPESAWVLCVTIICVIWAFTVYHGGHR